MREVFLEAYVTYYFCLRWKWKVRVCECIVFALSLHQDEHLCIGLDADSVAPLEKVLPRLAKLFCLISISLVHDHSRIQ